MNENISFPVTVDSDLRSQYSVVTNLVALESLAEQTGTVKDLPENPHLRVVVAQQSSNGENTKQRPVDPKNELVVRLPEESTFSSESITQGIARALAAKKYARICNRVRATACAVLAGDGLLFVADVLDRTTASWIAMGAFAAIGYSPGKKIPKIPNTSKVTQHPVQVTLREQ